MLAEFQHYLNSSDIYRPADALEVLRSVRKNFRFSYSNKKTKYFDAPCAFDIETSSFFRSTGKDPEKVAIMYMWSFCLYGKVIIGRTWEEFVGMIDAISGELQLTNEKRLIVGVHNLAYEFQFMRNWFTWAKVFAVDNRKPVYALTNTFIEFRCTYILSGYSLEKIGNNLQKYSVRKLVGGLDYDKIRHSETALTETELQYSADDVRVVAAYLAEKIENEGGLAKIPLTKTGYVRNYCRNNCFYEPGVSRKKSFKRLRYLEQMGAMQLEVDEYKQLKRAFQGGFTHANPFYSGKVVQDVTSYDFTSSYPAVMISEKFPISRGELVELESKEEFYKNLKLYCCVFDVEFVDLTPKVLFESYLSVSRCYKLEQPYQVNNGRLVSAAVVGTTLTEQDFLIVSKMYAWGKVRVTNFRRYKKGYLPTDFVKSILKLYEDKTTLKGVEGKEVEYLQGKEMLNSCYGMAVTDIVRSEYSYTDRWEEPKAPDYEKAIRKYNGSRSRFLFYPWGVWVTAYARRNLFTGILEFKDDYVYSDTDSIKVINAENHAAYIDRYNQAITAQIAGALDWHDIPRDKAAPKTIKGVKKPLGVWDFDGSYKQFKTLGAKRYLVQYADTGKHQLTVSGLNKKVCVPYLLEKYGESGIFEAFNNNLYIPKGKTGKMTHTYIDDLRDGVVVDYTGKPGEYHERSAVHLEAADYSLSMSREYLSFLLSVEEIEL